MTEITSAIIDAVGGQTKAGVPVTLGTFGIGRSNIARRLTQAAVRNPLLLPDGGTALATLTPRSGVTPTTGLNKSFKFIDNPALINLIGGTPTVASDGVDYSVPSTTVTSSGNFTATKNVTSYRGAFRTTAVAMELVLSNPSTFYRVMVDGQYAGKTAKTNGLNGTNILNITLGDTSYQPRRIDIELGCDVSFNNPTLIWGGNSGLGTLYVANGDSLMPLDTSSSLRMFTYGDSFSISTGATFVFNGLSNILAYLMGGVDVYHYQIGLGGTGWVNPGQSNYTNFLGHINDLSQSTFDIGVFMGGFNDVVLNSTPAQVTAAVVQTLTAARALSSAVFVVTGIWAGVGGASATTLALEAAIQAGVTQFNDPSTVFVPVSTDPNGQWMDGFIGPTLFANTTATGHPGDVGHLYLGRRLNAAIRMALRTQLGIGL